MSQDTSAAKTSNAAIAIPTSFRSSELGFHSPFAMASAPVGQHQKRATNQDRRLSPACIE